MARKSANSQKEEELLAPRGTDWQMETNRAASPTAWPSPRTCARCGGRFQTIGTHYLCPLCRKSEPRVISRISDLSRREQQIVSLIRQAKPNKQIAFELQLTEGTIKEYLHRIFRRLNVSSRTELALRSYSESLVSDIPA